MSKDSWSCGRFLVTTRPAHPHRPPARPPIDPPVRLRSYPRSLARGPWVSNIGSCRAAARCAPQKTAVDLGSVRVRLGVDHDLGSLWDRLGVSCGRVREGSLAPASSAGAVATPAAALLTPGMPDRTAALAAAAAQAAQMHHEQARPDKPHAFRGACSCVWSSHGPCATRRAT